MAATMSTLQDVLKNFYIGPIRKQLNEATVLLAQLKKSSKEVVGEQVILPLHMGRNWGIGARGTTGTGTLPTARNQQYDKAYFTTKDVYGRISISGKTIRATKSDRGAFLRSVESETKGMTNDLASDINRQLYGNGTGALTAINGAATSATQTVDSTQYLEEGMHIDIDTDLDNTISTINSTTSITLAGSITTADNDNLLLQGVSATDELNGLDLIVNTTGTLENIDPTTVTIWKGNVYGSDASPAVLNEEDMQEAQDDPEKKGGKINFMITSYGGRRKYTQLLASQKRFTSPYTGQLKGGFKAIDFNDIPMVVDRHCQEDGTKTRIYFLSLDSLGIYRMADFEWMKEDGNVLARVTGASATESYEGALVCDMEFATDKRRHNSVLKGVSLA